MEDLLIKIQEESNLCLCSVIQTILEDNNIYTSQGEIANNLTHSKNGFVAHDEEIKGFFREQGFEYHFYWHNETPFNEPDSVLREMDKNYGVVGIDTHTYLLRSFKDPAVEIVDPRKGEIVISPLYDVLESMRKTGGFFGLVKKMN